MGKHTDPNVSALAPLWARARKALVGGLSVGAAAVVAQLPGLDLSTLTSQDALLRAGLSLLGAAAGAAGVYWTRNAQEPDSDGAAQG